MGCKKGFWERGLVSPSCEGTAPTPYADASVRRKKGPSTVLAARRVGFRHIIVFSV